MRQPVTQAATAADDLDGGLPEVAEAVRRLARARLTDASAVDDVVQETLSRMLTARDRLDPDATLPYALTIASNLIVSQYRDAQRARRHQHRLLDLRGTAGPEETVLARERAVAVRAALAQLNDSDRRTLVAHTGGASTDALAEDFASTPGAVAARLARTRARMRLDYLLALRQVDLPGPTCRSVLMAISAGDQRRQRALDAGQHLLSCPTCPQLVEPLLQRRSVLVGIAAAPLVALGSLGGRIGHAARQPRHQIATATVAGVAAAGVAVAAAQGAFDGQAARAPAHRPPPAVAAGRPSPAPAPAPVRLADGRPLLPLPPASQLRAAVGRRATADGVLVQSVVAHTGFWIGKDAVDRVFVVLTDVAQLRRQVLAGHRLSFSAVLAAATPDLAARVGVTSGEGSGQLARQGVYLSAESATVVEH